MKSNKLQHFISIDNNLANCKIKIQLADECKNAHQDFSITGYFWEIGKVRNDRNMICGGCCHDEILKVRPDLKQFIDLHLCDFNGVPMYAEANGFYHLINGFERLNGKTQKEYFCDYYRVTLEQYDILIEVKEEAFYGYLLHELGIVENWKLEAIEAIKRLESITGTEFLNDSIKSHLKYTTEQIAEFKQKAKQGFYSKEKQDERHNNKIVEQKAKKLSDLKEAFYRKQAEAKQDFELNKIGIELFLTTSNFIFYQHRNEVVFNWQKNIYDKNWNKAEFDLFVSAAKKINILKNIDYKLN
jgi:hypothetical protein